MKIANGIYNFIFGQPENNSLTFVAENKPEFEKIDKLKAINDHLLPFDDKSIIFSKNKKGIVLEIPKQANEHIFGFGLQLKSFEQTGKKRYIRVNADPVSDSGDSHAPAPFYISDKGYCVLIDTLRYAKFYVGSNKRVGENTNVNLNEKTLGLTTDQLYSFKSGAEQRNIFVEIPSCEGVGIYIFVGDDMKDALQKYILFSGSGVMPPMWGLGYHYRLKSEYTAEEAMALTDEFEKSEMPLDMLGLEPGWHTKAYSCSFLWEKSRFPDSDKFINFMNKKNVKISLWQHAFSHPDSEFYNELLPFSSDFEVWEGLVPDFLTREGRQIFGLYQQENFIKKGISMMKLDECDSSDYTGGWSFPEFAKFPSGLDGEQMHSCFGILYQKTLLEGFEKENKRTWSMVRSSNALSSTMPFVLYSDLYEHGDFIRGLATAPLTGLLWSPEVRQCSSEEDLIRRMQTTVIAPLMCSNNWMIKLPAWKQFDYEKNLKGEILENSEELFQKCKAVVDLRMSLIPYLYDAFYKYYEIGEPPIRPIVLDYTDDETTFAIDNEFIIGDNILVCPCIKGDVAKNIYFPKGNWFCFYTGKKFEGSKYHFIETPIDYLPLFVKENSIIPVADSVLHISEDTVFDITLKVFGESPKECRLVCDDGFTNNYKKGEISLLSVSINGDNINTKLNGAYTKKRYSFKNIIRFK